MTLDISLAATSLWTISDCVYWFLTISFTTKLRRSWIDKQNNSYFVGGKRARKMQNKDNLFIHCKRRSSRNVAKMSFRIDDEEFDMTEYYFQDTRLSVQMWNMGRYYNF